MTKIIRVLEHNGIIFKEDDNVLVIFEDNTQIRGKIRLPITGSLIIGKYSLETEIKFIKHIKKLN